MSTLELKPLGGGPRYAQVSLDQSLHGSSDDVVEISLNEDFDSDGENDLDFGQPLNLAGVSDVADKYGYDWESMTPRRLWHTLTFGWMKDILQVGSNRYMTTI